MVLLVVVVQLFATPCTAARQASLSLTISQSLPMFMFMASVMPSNHFILWCPLLLPCIILRIRDFSNESFVHILWPKYWSFSFSISPPSEYSGLISLKIDWFDHPDVQGTSRAFSSTTVLKASILWHSSFFTYGPSLKTVHDHWEDHSLDYLDLCWQNNVSAFQHTV